MHPLNNEIRCVNWLDGQKQVHPNSNEMFIPTGRSEELLLMFFRMAETSCYGIVSAKLCYEHDKFRLGRPMDYTDFIQIYQSDIWFIVCLFAKNIMNSARNQHLSFGFKKQTVRLNVELTIIVP